MYLYTQMQAKRYISKPGGSRMTAECAVAICSRVGGLGPALGLVAHGSAGEGTRVHWRWLWHPPGPQSHQAGPPGRATTDQAWGAANDGCSSGLHSPCRPLPHCRQQQVLGAQAIQGPSSGLSESRTVSALYLHAACGASGQAPRHLHLHAWGQTLSIHHNKATRDTGKGYRIQAYGPGRCICTYLYTDKPD